MGKNLRLKGIESEKDSLDRLGKLLKNNRNLKINISRNYNGL